MNDVQYNRNTFNPHLRKQWEHAHRRSDIERVVEIERVIVNGQLTTRERDVTTRALDLISTL